jgi:hypothetical protein
VTEVVEHHRRGPHLADRVRRVLTGDVGRRAMDGLEHRGMAARRVQARARRHADRPGDGGREIGQVSPKRFDAGGWEFFVESEDGRRTRLIVAAHRGSEYLKTESDGMQPDGLLCLAD